MIYFVTSSISYKTLKERYLSLNINDEYIFLILDKFTDSRTKNSLDNKDLIIFLDSIFLDKFILDNFTSNDLLINFDGFHIFNNSVIDKIKYSSANFHPSPLPSYCGVNPISWALLNEESIWGATWHRISTKLDRGEIIYQELFPLKNNISQLQLLNFCIFLGLKNLGNVIVSFKNNNILNLPENNNKFSLYQGSEQPDIILNTLEDFKRVENIFPITPYIKWRWKLKFKNKIFTAISSTKIKGNIKFNKSLCLNNELIYYAD